MVLACVITYFIVSIGILDASSLELTAEALWQGQYGVLVTNLFTHTFIHSNITHLLSNMMFFVAIGAGLEARVGAKSTAIVYFAGAIVAGLWLVLTAVHPTVAHPLVIPARGASAAISAVMGAALIVSRNDIMFAFNRFGFELGSFTIAVPAITVRSWMLVTMYVGQNVLGLWTEAANPIVFHMVMAHLIGFVTGLAVIFLLVQSASDTHAKAE
ncbi:rhomboid family intramembrane serine protease [bacterium]|nr:rhomboid family intramembrane serine protease [bacterium]